MTEEITQKKGRGRPRKYPVETEPKEKRPRGRPKKPVDPETANLPKRPRGRPRKEVVESAPKEKRPRGRPKKQPIFADVQELGSVKEYATPRATEIVENAPEISENENLIATQPTKTAVNYQDVESKWGSAPNEEENENIFPKTQTEQEPTANSTAEPFAYKNDASEGENDFAEIETLNTQSILKNDLDTAEQDETTQDEVTAEYSNYEESDAQNDSVVQPVEVIDFTQEDAEEVRPDVTPARNTLEQKTTIFKNKVSNIYPAKHLQEGDVQGGMKVAYNEPKMESTLTTQKLNISTPHRPVQPVQKVINEPIYKTAFSGTDKVVVVTGATSGLGFAMARELAKLGQTVIAVGRRPSFCRDARNEILSEFPNAKIYYLVADMSLMSQVRILADEIKKKLAEIGRDAIDVLIHNAGVQTNMHKITYENHEYMWATNYLSVFLLTRELQPLLDKSKDARVITTTNSQNYKTKLNWADIRGVAEKANDDVYNQTKLADLMFALEYDHRYSNRDDLHAYCVDPGLVNTELRTKNTSGIKKLFQKHLQNKGKSVEQGIETTIYLAMAEKLPSNVVLYANKKPTEPSKYALDPRNRAALWRYSELELFG